MKKQPKCKATYAHKDNTVEKCKLNEGHSDSWHRGPRYMWFVHGKQKPKEEDK